MDDLAIFLNKSTNIHIWQYSNDSFRWAAESRSLRRHYDRSVDENWMFDHKVNNLIIRPFRII